MDVIYVVIIVLTAAAALVIILDFWWMCVMKVIEDGSKGFWEARDTVKRESEESKGLKDD